jgi:hypothetical protein
MSAVHCLGSSHATNSNVHLHPARTPQMCQSCLHRQLSPTSPQVPSSSCHLKPLQLSGSRRLIVCIRALAPELNFWALESHALASCRRSRQKPLSDSLWRDVISNNGYRNTACYNCDDTQAPVTKTIAGNVNSFICFEHCDELHRCDCSLRAPFLIQYSIYPAVYCILN